MFSLLCLFIAVVWYTWYILKITLYRVLYNNYDKAVLPGDGRCQAAYLSHYDTDMDGRFEMGLNDDVSFDEATSQLHAADNNYILIYATLFMYVRNNNNNNNNN